RSVQGPAARVISVQKARSRHRLVEHGKPKSFLIEPGWSNLPDANSTARSVAKTDYSPGNWLNSRKPMRFYSPRSGAAKAILPRLTAVSTRHHYSTSSMKKRLSVAIALEETHTLSTDWI